MLLPQLWQRSGGKWALRTFHRAASGLGFSGKFLPAGDARVAFAVEVEQPFFDPLSVQRSALGAEDGLDVDQVFLAEEHHLEDAQRLGIPDVRPAASQRHLAAPRFGGVVELGHGEKHIEPNAFEMHLAEAVLP